MNKIVFLTKQHKELLLYFLNNQDIALSKKSLIEEVWKGRTVADNTVDQSLSKLKKILNECQQYEYFETVYGQGMRFLPEVAITSKNNRKATFVFLLWLFVFVVLLSIFHSYFFSETIEEEVIYIKSKQPLVMILPQSHQIQDTHKGNSWLADGSMMLFEEMIKYSNFAQLKSIENKPVNLTNQQYLGNQWRISHSLNTLLVQITRVNNVYTISLVLTNNRQQKSTYKWSDKKLNAGVLHANQWLSKQFNHTQTRVKLLPEDSYLTELYMRGLSSLRNKDLVEASHYFEICIGDSPEFHLARLELVKIKIIQSNGKEALALLDVMNGYSVPVKISIEGTKLRSQSYELENELELAGKLLKDTIIKFKSSDYPKINELRYELSTIYLNLKQYDLALTELKNIYMGISENPELVAMAMYQQAIIYLQVKDFLKSEQMAKKSLEIYARLGDSLSLAKSHQLLAKISVKKFDNKSAETHLLQALSLYHSLSAQLESNLVIIDVLNELILVLIDQGQLTKAIELNKQLQRMALSENLTNILMDSKLYAITIAMKQKKWSIVKQQLLVHKALVDDNNQAGLINNKLLSLELLLNQNSVDGVELLFSKLQSAIQNTKGDFWLIRANLLHARYYILGNKVQKSKSLLITTKSLAISTQDYKAVVEINNILAQQYLLDKQSIKALSILKESEGYKPFAYPFLLLKSKANKQLGNNMKALELALEAKRKSSQLWSSEDGDYLKMLVEQNKSI